MSGTSLDGIDLALLNFTKNNSWSYKILASETIPYSAVWEKRLSKSSFLGPQSLQSLNEEYTHLLAEVIISFMRKHRVTELDAVCSHGHTVKHEPENGYTLQIGNLPKLANLTGQRVVCDFRVQDVKMGGQGAPLVPVGDELLFPDYDDCLNLGGFGNISTRRNGKRIAYDICAVNTVLNFLANKLGKAFDKDGALAASGVLDEKLLNRLNSLEYYRLEAPKSLGIEWVNRHIFPLFETSVPVKDLLHTFSVHAANKIASELTGTSEEKVLITGGGAFNSFLIKEIGKRTDVQLVIPSVEVVNFKEALIFGFLGVLKLRGEANVLSSVTGAEKDHSSGVIFEPQKPD